MTTTTMGRDMYLGASLPTLFPRNHPFAHHQFTALDDLVFLDDENDNDEHAFPGIPVSLPTPDRPPTPPPRPPRPGPIPQPPPDTPTPPDSP